MRGYVFPLFSGGAGLSSPLWLGFIDPLYQGALALIGFAVLVLTLWNKWLDNRIKRETLKDLTEDGDV